MATETPRRAQAARRAEIERAIDRALDDMGRLFAARWPSFWPALLIAVLVVAALWYLGVHAPGTLLFVAQAAFVVVLITLIAIGALWLLARPRLHWILPSKSHRTLDEYLGAPEVVAAARGMAALLRGGRRGEATEEVESVEVVGGATSQSALLVGPSGAGKGALARCLSAEAEAPLAVVGAASFRSLVVRSLRLDVWGLRSLYRQAGRMARAYGACVIYLDDVSALSANARDELRRQMALTSRPRHGRGAPTLTIASVVTLEPSLVDAIGFDHTITLTPPNDERRALVIAHSLDAVRHDDEIALPRLVAAFTGYTPGTIERVIAEAVALAHADGRESVSMRDLTSAREAREAVGLPALSPQEKRRLAYSEAGRAVAQVYAQPQRPLGRVALRRGRAAADETPLSAAPRSAEEVYADIEVALASRAAEDLFLQTRLENSAGDLARATELALGYVARWGMEGSFIAAATLTPESLASAPVAREQVERLLRRAYDDARALLGEHRSAVNAVAEALLERDVLYGDEVTQVMRQGVATSPAQMASPANVAEAALFGSRASLDSLAPAPHLVGPVAPGVSADATQPVEAPAPTAPRANGPSAFAASPSQELRADRVIDRAILRAPLRQTLLHKTDPNLPAVNSGAGANGANGGSGG